jgi:hypothetical protein
MLRITKKTITRKINKELLTTKLTLIIIGLTAGSALLIPATYASFHPVTTGEIADETIRSRDILNGQVGSVDIGTGQVASVDIRDGHVASVDIQDNTITSDDLGSNAVRRVVESGIIIGAGANGIVNVDCAPGEIVTGGGFISLNRNIHVFQDLPFDANTWRVAIWNQHTDNIAVNVYALCM